MPRAARTLRIHSLAEAMAALGDGASDRPLRLVLGGPMGWALCAALRAAAEAAVPGARAEWLYDPAGRAGHAALALREGATVIWPRTDPRHAALAALAAACGGEVVPPPRGLRGPLAVAAAKPALPRRRGNR